jgi:hypothetical protein
LVANQKSYAELVAQAEQAVAGVKDPELRRAAFERVLIDLFGSDSSDSPKGHSRGKTKSSGRSSRKAGKRVATAFAARRGGPSKYLEDLLDEGYFSEQKTLSEVKAELGNRGHHIPLTSLSGPLQSLCQKRKLRRQKIDSEGGRKTYGYSNW